MNTLKGSAVLNISKILCAALAALSLGVFAGPAHATVFVENLTLGAAPSATMLSSPNQYGDTSVGRLWAPNNISGFTSIDDLQAGDTVIFNVSFGAARSIGNNGNFYSPNDAFVPDGANAALSIGLINQDPSANISLSSSGSITFAGSADVPTQVDPSFTYPYSSPQFYVAMDADPSNTFSGFTLVGTVLSVSPQSEPFTGTAIVLADDPNQVPAPASLALFGFGLFGLGALRRKVKAA